MYHPDQQVSHQFQAVIKYNNSYKPVIYDEMLVRNSFWKLITYFRFHGYLRHQIKVNFSGKRGNLDVKRKK